MKVTVREVRKGLSRLLNRVEAGEEVVITRNGKEVAKLVPTSETSKVLPDLSAFRAATKLSGEPVSDTVIRMRRESRY